MVHTTVLESRRYFLEYCLERDRELSEPQKEFVGSRIACQHVCTLQGKELFHLQGKESTRAWLCTDYKYTCI